MTETESVLDGRHAVELWQAPAGDVLHLPGGLTVSLVGFRLVPPAQLLANPLNWRIHSHEQYEALATAIEAVGWIAPIITRETTDEMLDGHLRAKIADDAGWPLVPNLIARCDDEQARLILATLDPLAGMAGTDAAKLAELMADVGELDGALGSMLDDLLTQARALGGSSDAPATESQDYVTRYELVVECTDEASMEALFERLADEGFRCRTLIL